jgi:hypothetical protein
MTFFIGLIALFLVTCVPSYALCTVVGNTKSRIYHTAGGHFYEKMLRKNKQGDNRQCFPSVKAAQAAGYRASKR